MVDRIDASALAAAEQADFTRFKDSPDPRDMEGAAWVSETFKIVSREGRLHVGLYPADRSSDMQFAVCVDMLDDTGWIRMLRGPHFQGPFEADAEISLSCSQARFAGRECRVRVLADKANAIGIKVSHE